MTTPAGDRPRFSAYAFEPLSGSRIGEISTWNEAGYSHGLGRTGGGSLTMPWWDDIAASIEPLVAGIAIDDGGVLRWAGLVTSRDVSPDGGTVRFGCQPWWWYYGRRWIRSALGMTYAETANVGPYDVRFLDIASGGAADVDQFEIVEDLLAHAAAVAAGADLGLTVRKYGPGAGGNSGVSRVRDYFGYERKRIASAVEELAAQVNGFDFVIRSEWNTGTTPWSVDRFLDLYYPRAGESTATTVLEHGGNVSMLRFLDDGEKVANPIVIVGAGTGDAAITSERTDLSLIYPAGPYPLLEDERQYRDMGTEYDGALERLGDAELAVYRRPLRTAQVRLTEQADGLRLGDIGIGDSLPVVAEFGGFAVNDRLRYVAESVRVSPSTVLDWTADLATDDATLGVL